MYYTGAHMRRSAASSAPVLCFGIRFVVEQIWCCSQAGRPCCCPMPRTIEVANISVSDDTARKRMGRPALRRLVGKECRPHHVLEDKRVAVYEQQHGCGHLCAAPAFPGSTHILVLRHPCCQHLYTHHMRSAHDAGSHTESISHYFNRILWHHASQGRGAIHGARNSTCGSVCAQQAT